MSEDIFDLAEDDDEVSQEATSNREAAARRKTEKQIERLNKELEDLRTFKAEREKVDRQSAVSATFREVGLQPEWAEFYQGEEVTPEAVKQWAVTKKFLTVESEAEEPAAPAPAPTFTPTVIDGSQPVGVKEYSVEEFQALLKSDPHKAEAVYKAGRLKKEEPDWAYSSRFYGRDS